MRLNVKKRIAALRRMTVKELRQRHVELFGEPTRSANRQWLFRRMAWRVQALAEGDLPERARRRAHELARDADVRLRPPKEPEEQPADQAGPGLRVVADAAEVSLGVGAALVVDADGAGPVVVLEQLHQRDQVGVGG